MKTKKVILTILCIFISAVGISMAQTAKEPKQFDLVVYGGSSAGVMAAVQAAKMGKNVVLISPTKHLGGLSSSGLGWTDLGNSNTIGGLSLEF
jgi:ribulose 1,5-bisphosphate synthetase/thiazole synthase